MVAFWRAWLTGLATKPTLLLSLHPYARAPPWELLAVLHLYRFGAPWGGLLHNLGLGGSAAAGELPVTAPASALTADFLRACAAAHCDLILSDYAAARG